MKQKILHIGLIILMILLSLGLRTQANEILAPEETIKWRDPVVVTNYSPRGDPTGGNFTGACGRTVLFVDSHNWSREKFLRMYPNKQMAERAFKYKEFGSVAMARGRAKELGVVYGSVIFIKDIKTKTGEHIPLIVQDCYGPSKGIYYSRFKARGSFDICWSHIKVAKYGTRMVQYAVVGYVEDPAYRAKNKLMGYKHGNEVIN